MRTAGTVLLALLGGLTFNSFAAPGPTALFVAPNGNDTYSGRLHAPNANATDGPFATLVRARNAARELARQGDSVLVVLQPGFYTLTEPLVFTPEDSGVSFGGLGQVTLSGGRRITNWKPVSVQGRQLWAADLPAVRAGQWYFRQLWINDERRVRARHPNVGYLEVAEVPDTKPDTPWSKGQTSFRFKAGDLRAWPTLTNAEVRVMNRWVESHLPVVSLDESNRLVRFGKRSVFKLDPGDPYYLENALEALDTPGEWYLDRAAGTLYCLPLPGEDLRRAEVIAPALAQLIRLEGRPESGQFVQNLVFRGITFAHTEWYFPWGFAAGENKVDVDPAPADQIGGFAQAAVGVPGAVYGVGARQCRFEECRLLHLGGYGLELARGCQSNRIARCEFDDLGAGGLKLGETALRANPAELARANMVSDCEIHDGGRVFHSGIGLWIGQSPDNRVRHNHIHDFYYSGLSVGWTWGYGRALATNTLVEFNHVHHIGQLANGDGPILSDMAGIYTLGWHRGSVIRNNLWHDIAGLRYGGWGIYFDEGTTEILAENNLVMRTTHGGFHQHYGRDNVVRNNIFVDARDHQVQRSRPEQHRSFIFERNLVAWHTGKLLEGNFDATNDSRFVFRSNLYWLASGGDFRFWNYSLEDWRQRGQDADSLIANPLFADPARDNYTLPANSPALRLGFKPFDVRGAGVRPR